MKLWSASYQRTMQPVAGLAVSTTLTLPLEQKGSGEVTVGAAGSGFTVTVIATRELRQPLPSMAAAWKVVVAVICWFAVVSLFPSASVYHFTVLAEVAVRVMSPSPQMLVLDTAGAAGRLRMVAVTGTRAE